MSLHPEVLDGEAIDAETLEPLDVEALGRLLEEHGPAIGVLMDLERGLVQMTLVDYRDLGATFIQARQVVRAAIREQKPK